MPLSGISFELDMTSLLTLEGRVAYITGSTRGIGNSIAHTLAAAGASVVVNGCAAREAVERTAHEISERHGVRCIGVVADQADPAAARGAFRQIHSVFGRLDVLVNNAGVMEDALLGMIPEATLDRTFAVNALSVARNMQSAAGMMRRAGAGSIINLSSIIGTNGNPGQVVYAGSKAAVIGMTRSAAKELAPFGIRVNAIAPGFIDTDMTRSIPPAKFQERLASIGLGRLGVPQDVANVALFLASDLSSYVTGQVIGVDGSMVV
jgi:3-oxoacyl-[acyl-carrier protein] reductase